MKFLRWSAMLMVFALVLIAVAACGDADDGADGAATTVATVANGAGDEATEAGEEATEADDEGDGAVAGDAANGEALATSKSCVACHSVDGTQMTGPTWQGLYGHEVTLGDGSTVTADDEYIKNSILKPNDQIVEGFVAAMPSFEGQLTDQEIADLTAYIASLE